MSLPNLVFILIAIIFRVYVAILFHFILSGVLWKEWCWSWNSSTLATSSEELTRWKRLWCWEGLGAGGEGDDRGWDGWMASLTWWTWVWVNSGSWWWTRRPGVLWFMGSQRVGHDWATELNWTAVLDIVLSSKDIVSNKTHKISASTRKWYGLGETISYTVYCKVIMLWRNGSKQC